MKERDIATGIPNSGINLDPSSAAINVKRSGYKLIILRIRSLSISFAASGDVITALRSATVRRALWARFCSDLLSRPNAVWADMMNLTVMPRSSASDKPGTGTPAPNADARANHFILAWKTSFFLLMISRLILGMAKSKAFLLWAGSSLSNVSSNRWKSYRWRSKLDTRKTCGDSTPCFWRPVA